jgi:hypothetical protein
MSSGNVQPRETIFFRETAEFSLTPAFRPVITPGRMQETV